MTKHCNSIVLALFFLSGFTGLCYEICWIRSSSQMFGATTFAVSSVVALLFTGMALGTHYFDSRSRHYQEPLKIYDRPILEYDTSRTSFSPQRFKKLFEEQHESPRQIIGFTDPDTILRKVTANQHQNISHGFR